MPSFTILADRFLVLVFFFFGSFRLLRHFRYFPDGASGMSAMPALRGSFSSLRPRLKTRLLLISPPPTKTSQRRHLQVYRTRGNIRISALG